MEITRLDILSIVRDILPAINLDPASNIIANSYVNADHFYDEQDNGLRCDWYGNVYVNPPLDLVEDFLLKTIEEIEKEDVFNILFYIADKQLLSLQLFKFSADLYLVESSDPEALFLLFTKGDFVLSSKVKMTKL